MTETSRLVGSSPSAEHNIIGPDYFGFYTRQLAEFLSQDQDHLPFLSQNCNVEGKDSLTKNDHTSTENYKITSSASLFSDAIGADLSDFSKEKLRSMVCESLFTFTQEVDEILNPIHQICRVQSLLRYKKSMLRLPGGPSGYDHGSPQKKQKVSAFASSLSGPCGLKFRPEEGPPPVTESDNELYLDANIQTVNEKEIDGDLLFLLDNDYTKVEEMTKKHSDELLAMIRHMEQKLEEFLDILMSKCRSMALAEKQQLRKLIQDLPPRNLDRIVEIIQHNKPVDRYSSDEIYVDLEKENKVTLWRLYFYVEAVENARKLCVG